MVIWYHSVVRGKLLYRAIDDTIRNSPKLLVDFVDTFEVEINHKKNCETINASESDIMKMTILIIKEYYYIKNPFAYPNGKFMEQNIDLYEEIKYSHLKYKIPHGKCRFKLQHSLIKQAQKTGDIKEFNKECIKEIIKYARGKIKGGE